MPPLTLTFEQISASDLPRVGGKGANLGEMTRAGFPVPPGFCVSAAAFAQFMASYNESDALYASLNNLAAGDIEGTRKLGRQIREQLGGVPIPPQIAEAVLAAWQMQGSDHAYAVRSSATAEDLPDASFAGQQDTYLNVRGSESLLESVRACWISLFTDRAILYRAQNGFSHHEVQLSVVVQQMVMPQVSGILFTADPVSGNRQIISIDASYGLGEALVSGLVSADLYKVDKRDGAIVETNVADKKLAIRPNPEGGVYRETLSDDLRAAQVLAEDQIRQLAKLGGRIEAHYGKPQDIEWCYEDERLYIVQSRPITSLFPLPQPRPNDDNLRVYISFSHAQVMTDPMPPMGISVWRILFPFGTETPDAYNPYLLSAAGRLYADISPLLYNRIGGRIATRALTAADSLMAQTITGMLERDNFKQNAVAKKMGAKTRNIVRWLAPLLRNSFILLWFRRPEGAASRLSVYIDSYIDRYRVKFQSAASSVERLKMAELWLGKMFNEGAFPLAPNIAAGIISKAIIEKLTHAQAKPADLDALWRGMAGNVTTEMDLQVGDLADAARQSPQLLEILSNEEAKSALQNAPNAPGSEAFLLAWAEFITRYGMRGPSEIDITRPRWQEEPASVMQVIVSNLQHAQAGGHRAHHRRLAAEAEVAGERLVTAARHGLFGPLKAAIVRRMVRVTRSVMPVREHPKYLLIRAFALVKQTVLEAAETLVEQNRLDALDDIWYLELPEVIAALENPTDALRPRIAQRRNDMARFWKTTPPRVITSDGEIPVAKQSAANIPAGALPGSPVSAGVVEGIAKVVLDPATQSLKPGEILVAPFTDPGWTPLFINAAGLVMEVGGLMTHGSVVAREYGIPAVVGVVGATQHIQSGQRIRVRGDLGYVEILEAK